MAHDNVAIQTTKANFELLCDVATFLSLVCIMPLLEIMQRLSQFAQGQQIVIYNFVYIVKLVDVDVFNICCDVGTRFLLPHHLCFFELVDHYNDVLLLVWWTKNIS
jgi:hypothetical protein